MPPIRGVIFDVDGTLVDSNDAHARAWEEAFREAGHPANGHASERSGIHSREASGGSRGRDASAPLFNKIRSLIGMGGDKLVPALTGWSKDDPRVEKLGGRRGEIFRERHLPHIQPFPRTRELLLALRAAGLKLAVATSAEKEELEPLLERAGASDLIEHKASSDDAESSKPDPDIVQAALRRLGLPKSDVVMIGDTPYDVEAATRAGIPIIAFRSGGWDDESLKGAREIYDGPADLLEHLSESMLSPSRSAYA
jgi:HAD superfamily hydrolase (TIGR01509 family)